MNLYNDYLEKARDLANQVYDQGVKALSKTETERRLAEALSHANWGASTTLMGEIAQATNDTQEHQVIMREIWAACASTGRNWRVCYKGLALLEFLLKNGHKRVIEEAKENRSKIRRLETFSYLKDGVEKGGGVREKAKAVTELLDDDDFLKRERSEAAKLRAKFTGVGRDGQMGGGGGSFGGGGGHDSDEDKKRFASSDSDDDSSSKKKKSSKSKKKGSDDEASDDEDEKPSKSKSKKKSASADDDDDDFPATKSKSKSSKKKSDDEDDDFGFSKKGTKGTTAPAASKKKNEDDDVDFGFSDDDSSSKASKPAQSSNPASKAKPLGTIQVKIPGAGASSAAAAAAKPKKAQDEVDLLGGFDPFGSSSSAPATQPQTAAKPQQSSTADIMGLFSAPPPPQSAASMNAGAFGGFPAMPSGAQVQQQPGFPGMAPPSFPGLGSSAQGMPAMFPPMSPMGMPPMMMGQPQQQQQQQPMGMMMGGGMMMPQQQPMMGNMMMPQQQQQQPMMMMQQQQPMMGMPMMGGGMQQARPMVPQQQSQQPQKKQDAFSGLMDFGAPMSSSSTTSSSKPPPQSLI